MVISNLTISVLRDILRTRNAARPRGIGHARRGVHNCRLNPHSLLVHLYSNLPLPLLLALYNYYYNNYYN